MPDQCVAVNDSRPWWLWPNLLSLDAPAIAVIWQMFLADVEGIQVPIAATITLALVVWCIYLIDRRLDGCADAHSGTDRHRFAARHPHLFAVLACLALCMAGTIAVLGLPIAYFEVGSVVAFASIAYFAVIHLGQGRFARCWGMGLKEITVGTVFALGVAIPLIVTSGRTGPQWVPGVIAFGGLCALNCILISRWEDTPSTAPPGWLVIAMVGVTTATSFDASSLVAATVMASLGLLTGLVIIRKALYTRALRVLADASLLTPLVVAVLR